MRTKLLNKLSLGWLIVFLMPVAAQQIESAKLPDSLAGQRVAAYLKAFNSGDEQLMRSFFQENVSPAAMQQRPIDLRLEAYHEMRGNIGTIALRRVLKATENNIVVLVQGKDGGWREITFEFEVEAQHRFLALGVEDVAAPSGTVTTTPPRPMTNAEVLTSVEKYLDGLVAADDFSGTVLIAKGATPIFQKAYGFPSKEYNIPNRIEKVSGQDYYSCVRERIFKPAGMEDTDYYEADMPTPNIASGYTSEGVASAGGKLRRNNIYTRPARGSSAGGGYSTAADLLKFSLALQSEKLSLPAFRKGETKASSQGNMGVAGGANGINAVLEMNFATGFTIVVMSNYDPPSAGTVGQQIRAWIANSQPNGNPNH